MIASNRGQLASRLINTLTRGAVPLILGLTLYFAVGLFNLRLPGLQYDEAADAVPAIEVLQGREPSTARNVTIFGKRLPLMMLHHIGPTTIYTSLVGLATLGISVEALRVSQLAVGGLALVGVWLLARHWFDGRVAALAVLLCATSPPFVWWSRAGANWTVPLLPMALFMWLALTHWWRRGSLTALLLAAFLFGLGLTTKILFVWWLAPITLVGLVAIRQRRAPLETRLRGLGRARWVGALLAFALGAAPLIAHNLPNGETLRFILANAAQTQLYGHNNLDFLNNLRKVSGEFLRVMGGDTIHFWAPAGVPIGAGMFVAAWLYGMLRWLKPSASLARLALVLTPVAMLPLSTISTSSIGATYLFTLLPLAWLLVAAAALEWLSRLRLKAAHVGLWALLSGIMLNHLVTSVATHRFFAETGGRGFWSDVVYDLAGMLEQRFAGRTIVAMDWGFRRSLEFLTENRVRPREAFGYTLLPNAEFDQLATALIREPDNVYLFHAPEYTAFPKRWERLERAALQQHKRLVLEAALRERDGTTNTLIYTARPAPRQFAPPQDLPLRDARFEHGLRLLGGEVRYDDAARELFVRLYWQSHAQRLPDDTVLLHVVDQSTGAVVLVADKQPVYGSYPFDRWVYGEVVSDPHWVTLPADLPSGVYQVRVGVYDRQTGARRAIDDPQDDAAGNSLMLQTFQIP
ncbi:MAG: glycosyltransferase family 39 protein [Thermoflexales bacterium]|nr:glycosyltransferase family 39 protein [Thermoflexales bacterium]